MPSRSSATRTICPTTGRRCRRKCCAPRWTTSPSSPPSSTRRTTSPCGSVTGSVRWIPPRRRVTLADGSELGYDELIIATGLVPRTIPSFPDLEGIRVLRSLDESIALREHAGSARNAVVVGAGFIGCEVAASLRGMGVNVVLVEPQPTPLASVLGEQIGALVTRLHEAEGVDVRCGVGVDEVRGTDHVEKVVLSDGAELDADLVVVGIGSKTGDRVARRQRHRVGQRRGLRRRRPHRNLSCLGDRRRRVMAAPGGTPSPR